jgi:single-strand DNA-binding protein
MINKVILVGNVGADPEIKTLDSGVKMARIRLATTERVFNKEKNESTDITEWHNITLWRGLADVVDRYVRKGSQLYLDGKLRTREYEKNGVKCFATEIVADELKMLGKREDPLRCETKGCIERQPSVAVSYEDSPAPMPPIAAPSGDDLPF